jgi:hypothetical protein
MIVRVGEVFLVVEVCVWIELKERTTGSNPVKMTAIVIDIQMRNQVFRSENFRNWNGVKLKSSLGKGLLFV